jgi:hypothetical protein
LSNSNIFNTSKLLNSTLKEARELKFLQNGCTDIESLVSHEFGHVLTINDLKRGKTINTEFIKIRSEYNDALIKYADRIAKQKGIDKNTNNPKYKELEKDSPDYISEYADTKLQEFVAEGFAMALHSPAPSRFALQIKDIIDKYYSLK